MKNSIIVIAEAGVNHNGSIKIAKQLIDAAANSGADYVKFQTFKTGNLVTKKAFLAPYQRSRSPKKNTQFELLKKLEISFSDHKSLINYALKRKIGFLTTAFDYESLNFISKLGLDYIKIPSGEITNLSYLRFAAKSGKKILLSTGMSNLNEIRDAIKVLQINKVSKKNIIILHCSSEYPLPLKNVNLKAMITIKEKFGINIGYSDHSEGIIVPISAVSMGAIVIEKHLTLSKKMKGPDHASSIEPKLFKKMVESIREVETILGSGVKKPSKTELENLKAVRKYIVANKEIKKGDKFNISSLNFKRTGKKGISPMIIDKIINKKAKKDFKKDDLITI
tara:strand:+ start:1155 stop:2165 length:1011 start_codon:yes stop_codon:yes gene_type:complete